MMYRMKKILCIMLCGTLAISNVQIAKAETTSEKAVTDVFSDVHNDWYTEYVQYVYDNELMTGIKGTDRFEPNANITKAQVAQVLYNMEEQPEVTEQKVFEELKDVYSVEWYANAVSWAYNTGVVTGDLNTKQFSPNANVTREQLALMMYRYADYKEYDVTATSDYAGLVNADKVNNWAADGMSWAVGAGLISGVEKNDVKDLDPQGNASRAQMAAILKRFCESVKEAPVETPEITEEPEVTPGITGEPEVTPGITEEPEVTPEITEEPEVTPEITEEPEVTPEITEEPEVTPEITEEPEVTPEITEEPEVTPEITEEPEVTPEITEEPEVTPGITEEPEVTPEITEVPEVTPGEPSDATYTIYPIVRDVNYAGVAFEVEKSVNVVYEDGIDDATKAYFEEVLDENGIEVIELDEPMEGEFNFLLGINGSGEVADMYEDTLEIETENLYDKFDAYVLDAKDKQITIVGKDSDAVYWGVATLKMMFSSMEDRVLVEAKIEDYAGIEFRGFIEGFYGGWDYETRAELMEFARDVKMNMYVYASKTDTYHTSNWAGLYPAAELAEIEKLVKIGEETKCYYVWSVHLGSFFSGLNISNNPTLYKQRYDQLVAKFTQLYNVGVRKFDILNDDFGSGSHADVVTLLNDLTKNFIEPMGCEPITYCPQGYNEAWSQWASTINELPTLKDLDDSIMIYWTGADVNSPITQSTVNYVNNKCGQPVAYWLNYPVNEHAKSGIFLGNIDHYARDGVTGLKAAVSNPSRFGQSNKVALFQLASLFWNNSNYSEHSENVWLDSFNYLEEGVEEAYRTIGRNLANCPNSSRVGAGFPESEYIKANLEAVLAAVANGEKVADLEDTEILLDEFANILDAIETFRKDCKNTDLVTELNPWLDSLTDAVVAAEGSLNSVIALEKEDYADAWSNFAKASKAFQTWNTYKSAEDITNPALGGSKRIQPFAAELVGYVESTLTPIFDANYSGQSLIAVLGGQKKSMDDNAAKMFDGDEATSTQWNTIQQKDDYFGVDLGVVKKVTDISIVQGNTDADHDYFHKAVLEYSADGKTYTPIGERYNDKVRIELDNLDIEARFVRLRLEETGTSGKPDYWTHVREFTVNKQIPDGNRVYTNLEAYAKQPLCIEGNEYSLRDLENVTLKEDDYLGIKFTDLVMVSSVTLEGTGMDALEFEYSENDIQWASARDVDGPVILKYICLRNVSGSAVTFDLEKIGVVVESAKADPKFLATNLTNGIKEGSWENVFDGNESTYVWTNEGQTNGDFITFDLGAQIALYDFEAVTGDGNPRFYNAEIQISTDNKTWDTIATVVNDNSVFEVPYRYVRANAEGEQARYIRIYFTANSGYYFKLHEIFFNTTVEASEETAEIQASFGDGIENAIDGNLSTIFSGKATAEDFVEYKFTEACNYHGISILQDPENISNAEVQVLMDDGYVTVGKLDESAKKFELDPSEYVYGLRIEFEKETDISLYEIYLDADTSGYDDIGEYVEPIIVQPSEEVTTPTNIALGRPVTVSGTSDGDKAGVTDGTDTKWDSDPIKGANAKENSWVYLDLGADKTSIFSDMTMKYFNKIYPTAMSIQVSNDAQNWTTIKDLTSANNGPTYPVVKETFATAYAARYVRLFFDELNTAAAGNGVGVIEWEITGITLDGLTLKSVEAVADVEAAADTAAADLALPKFVKVVLDHATAEDQEVLVPVSWDLSAYDGNASTYEIEGTLNLPKTVKAENAKVTVNVVVK